MATSKTLNPTNVSISIPALGDVPDASVFSNCIDKEADAINALNSQIGGLTVKYGTFTHSVTATAKGNIYGDTNDVDIDIGVPSGKTIRAICIYPNSDHTVWVGRTAVSGNKVNRLYVYSASALSAVTVTFSYVCWYS